MKLKGTAVLAYMLVFSCVLSGSNYWQQSVKYNIHVTLDDSAHTLSGHEELTYTNNSPDTLHFIWFHLWPNAYKNNQTGFAKQRLEHYSTRFNYAKEEDRGYIDSLDFRIDNQTLVWEYHPDWIDVARVFLIEPLSPDSSVTIKTPFFVKLPLVFSRLGHTENHYEITQWYPKPAVYDRDGWHPMPYLDQGEFYSEFGQYDVFITLPCNYRIMATGDLVDGEKEYAWLDSLAAEGEALYSLSKRDFKKEIKRLKKRSKERKKKEFGSGESDTKTVHFFQENVHDFAWFADENWIVRKGELSLPSRKITLWSMYLPKHAAMWENSIEYIHDAGYWYSVFYGDYPYNHITAVDGDMSAGGGMEYPNITVISIGVSKDLLEYVIMHEVGHNWFYGILGSNERDHAWMDEGINEYTNIRYWEKKYPNRKGRFILNDFVQNKLGIARNLNFHWMGYVGYQIRAVSSDDQPIEMTSTDFARSNYGIIVYYKTAIFMRFLHHYLGEEKMDEIMRDFYHTWMFKHPSPDDFRSFFEAHVNEDLNWFFEDVFKSTRVIDYAVSSLDHGQVTLENKGSMVSPVELVFFRKDGTEIESRWLPGFPRFKTITIPDETDRVIIDPENYMPDINRNNNVSSKSLRLNFVFDQPTFHYHDVSLLPWFEWNAYNATTLGFAGYNGFLPGYFHGIRFSPQWDFRHNKIVGSLAAQKTFHQSLGFRKVTLSAGVDRHSGRQGWQIDLKGLIRKAIESTPSISINVSLFYHDIDSLAVDNNLYSPGIYTLTNTAIFFQHRPNPFIRYRNGIGFNINFEGDTFSQVYFTGDFSWRYHNRLTLNTRYWVGSFISGEKIPAQYRTWMSGGVDPNFRSHLVLNRTGTGHRSPVNIYDEQYLTDGPSLRGIKGEASTSTAWGLNFDQRIRSLPVDLFADIAGATDIEDIFFDAGLKLSFGVIHFYIPLYQSWEDHTTPTDFEWLKTKVRFEFRIPSTIQISL